MEISGQLDISSVFNSGPVGDTLGYAITVDDINWCYVAESTGRHIPIVNAYDDTYDGHLDIFVMKIDPTGAASIIWSTLFGGSGCICAYGVAVT